ncbi:MAG: hypothetical protein GX416_04570 [Bacteroidales bacterium]|nr:hypothetical protein [Bacteroidales bacterium]
MIMNRIPKIIHLIWSGIDEPLPDHFKTLGSTWQRDYPDWEYILLDKRSCIMNTASPSKLVSLYQELDDGDKSEIYLIPAKYISPFDQYQFKRFFGGKRSDDLEHCLDEAYAVHYSFNTWVRAVR